MTIIGAINRIDALKPNAYTQTEKVEWLSTLDRMIKNTVIDTHEDGEDIVFFSYDDETPLSKVLLVPEPYDDMYVVWLESKIDYTNGEYAKYNNSITRFNDTYKAYCNEYNRLHVPKGCKFNYY